MNQTDTKHWPATYAERAMEIAREAILRAELSVSGALTILIGNAIQAERERCASIVNGWHIKKGGYTELAHVLMTGMEPEAFTKKASKKASSKK